MEVVSLAPLNMQSKRIDHETNRSDPRFNTGNEEKKALNRKLIPATNEMNNFDLVTFAQFGDRPLVASYHRLVQFDCDSFVGEFEEGYQLNQADVFRNVVRFTVDVDSQNFILDARRDGFQLTRRL